MGKYFLRRIVMMLPTLFIISVVAFWLAKMAPGDPVECGTILAEMGEDNYEAYLVEYARQVELKGLDNPPFYFTFNSLAHPDTLQKVFPKLERQTCETFIQASGNWTAIQHWRTSIQLLKKEYSNIKGDLEAQLSIDLNKEIRQLEFSKEKEHIIQLYKKLNSFNLPNEISLDITASEQAFTAIFTNAKRWKLWIPSLSWNGFTNQYHQWISRMLKGDFGLSCNSNVPVSQVLGPSLKWTLLMTIPAIFLAFLISIPIGIYSGLHVGSNFDRWSSILVFVLYAMPSFWVAILLLVFFTSPEYSTWLDWFPSVGLGRLPATAPFWSRFWETASHLILPIICMVYGSIAFISRQMRSGILDVLPQQYILTAKAKGLGTREITKKHILKNALFPIITLAAGILPAAISGSVIIEVIFNIPGMGRTSVEAILGRDWPVVYAIFFLGAVLTILGIFITDLLYAWADPRVKFKSSLPDNQ